MPTTDDSITGRWWARTRTPRPRLAMFGIPLLMAAAFLANQIWAGVPLALCAWWWAPRDPRWYWLIAVGRGIVATEWTVLGDGALSAYPEWTTAISLAWAGVPMLFALRRVSMPTVSPRGGARKSHRRPKLPARTPAHL